VAPLLWAAADREEVLSATTVDWQVFSGSEEGLTALLTALLK
jgi:hypothetical protein